MRSPSPALGRGLRSAVSAVSVCMAKAASASTCSGPERASYSTVGGGDGVERGIGVGVKADSDGAGVWRTEAVELGMGPASAVCTVGVLGCAAGYAGAGWGVSAGGASVPQAMRTRAPSKSAAGYAGGRSLFISDALPNMGVVVPMPCCNARTRGRATDVSGTRLSDVPHAGLAVGGGGGKQSGVR